MTAPWPKDWRRRKWTAAEWNAGHPVGTPGRYYPTEGFPEYRFTRTRSEAYDRLDEAVVFIERQGGFVLVSHLEVVTADQAELERMEGEAEAAHHMDRIAREIRSVGAFCNSLSIAMYDGRGKAEDLVKLINRMQGALEQMRALDAGRVPA